MFYFNGLSTYTTSHFFRWYGNVKSSSIYWYIIPSAYYQGYTTKYYRYNDEFGAYYAPLLTISPNTTLVSMINATEYTDTKNNYHTSFVIDPFTAGYPSIETIYYATSDQAVTRGDFSFVTLFWGLVEFLDANSNGQFDDGIDTIVNTIPLNQTISDWSAVTLYNSTVAGTNHTFIEGATTARLVSGNSSSLGSFDVTITFRASNVQVNQTSSAMPLEPNSIVYDFSIEGFPFAFDVSRLAVLTMLGTPYIEPALMDINTSNSASTIQQIMNDVSTGVSIGSFSQGRFEWISSVLTTNITGFDVSGFIISTFYKTSLLAMTVPRNSMNTSTGTANITGFVYLDADVLSAQASGGFRKMTVTKLAIVLIMVCGVFVSL